MRRLSDIMRIVKCVMGILLIACFFLPWVAQTPSCMDTSVIIRDNISGFSLVREGAVTQALIAPLFGAIVAAIALAVRGNAFPLAGSLVSLAEVLVAFFAAMYIDLSVRLFTPYVVRYGYIATEALFLTILLVSFLEVVVNFPRLAKKGKIIVAAALAVVAALILLNYL